MSEIDSRGSYESLKKNTSFPLLTTPTYWLVFNNKTKSLTYCPCGSLVAVRVGDLLKEAGWERQLCLTHFDLMGPLDGFISFSSGWGFSGCQNPEQDSGGEGEYRVGL